jgi:hypothetical protein
LIDLFIFLWNYLNLLKASPSLGFGPCLMFFLAWFLIDLFSYETIWTY